MVGPIAWVGTLAAIYGLAWIVAESKLTFPLRREVANTLGADSLILVLLECPVCQSFWYGLAAGFFFLRLGFWFSLAFALVSVCSSAVLWRVTQEGQ